MLGCVTVMSNGDAGEKSVDLGMEVAGVSFRDYLGHRDEKIVVGDHGKANFPVHGGSVSVWVRADVE
jgi:alpha-amylase